MNPLPLIAVIVNLNAMLLRRKGFKYIQRLKGIAKKRPNIKIIIVQEQEEEINEDPKSNLLKIVRKLKERNVAYICACGGDGTLRLVVQTVIEVYEQQDYPIIASIGGGSMSMIAKALGFKKAPHKNLQTVIRLRQQKNQPISPKQVLKIEYEQETLYGLFFSIGVIPDFLKFYENSRKGWWTAIRLILTCILGTIIPPLRIHHYSNAIVKYDSQEFPKQTFAGIIVSNIKKLVLTFRPLAGFLYPNQFLLGLFALNAWEILSRLPKYAWGFTVKKHHQQDKVFNGNGSYVEIETNEDFTIDGDVFKIDKTVTFKISPGPSIPMLNLDLSTRGI